jgi:ABC-type sugar transport system ATPase subunit
MIEVQNLSITLGNFSMKDVSFTLPSGKYGALMGKTGTGKTTILESICGLKTIGQGTIKLMGRDVTKLKASERGIGFVPQDGALFSSMTVYENIAFALNIRKWKKSDIQSQVEPLAELLGITYLLKRSPEGLSGGERQRVALGRALSFEPGILCMDEPLSALDDYTRSEICDLFCSIREKHNVTILHITHRMDEAKRLADQVFLIDNGEIKQLHQDEIDSLNGINLYQPTVTV